MLDLTHLNENNEAHMVDISGKASTTRTARASGVINMSPQAIGILADNAAQKGDVLGVARVAAIQATKQTGFLIPLCHPISLTHVRVDFNVDVELARVKATVTATTKVARLGKARVVPFTQERLADGRGYRLVIHPPLADFPGESEEADCLRINQWIEQAVSQHPEQYLWAHRRFKTRPAGEPKLYRKRGQ